LIPVILKQDQRRSQSQPLHRFSTGYGEVVKDCGHHHHSPDRCGKSSGGLARSVLWYTIRHQTPHGAAHEFRNPQDRQLLEETFIEGGKATDKPVTMVGLAVVMKNPWVGNGFVEDLKPQIRCSDLGAMMVERLVGIIGGAERSKPTARRPWSAPTAKSNTPRP
jgi:hypothetical protein